MKTVTLAKVNGETKEVSIKFSVGYLFLGPIYHLFKGLILRGLLFVLLYVAILFIPLYDKALIDVGMNEAFMQKLLDLYWFLVGGLVVVHILLAFITPRFEIKRLCKKGYVPYAEIDTQLLIKHNLAKVGTLCYLSSFKAVDGVQGKIKMGNSKDLEKELNELKELLKEGMITKDEYETKRAMAIMRSGSKK